ncbi:MAG TPA: MFS transporter [Gaiellaceae bacterium]|nr:MFS transporter [Gaiellaceae bacterium]
MQHSYESLDRQGGFARVGLLRPLRSRDFRMLWTGQTVSLVGDGIFLIAMAWTAFQLWNSPASLSTVGIAMTIPTIACLLLGGAVSDRFDRRRVMIASDAVRAVAVSAIAALELTGHLNFAAFALLVAFYGAATAFFTPAFESIVPSIVPQEDLAQANSLDQFVRPGALRLVGPALGGVMVASTGSGGAFAIDAVTFLVSMAAVAAIRPVVPAGDVAASTGAAIADGFRFVRRHAWIWATLLSAAIAYLAFLGPTEALVPFLVRNDLHASATALGLVFAAGGIGAIVAAFAIGQRGQPRRDITFMYVCWTLATVAVAGYGLGRNVVQLMVACLVFNALETAGTIVWATIKQRHVPGALLGRVSSLDWLISIGLLPVSYGLTAPVATVLGARTTLVGAAVIGSAVTFSALFVPGVRDVEARGPRASALRGSQG